MFVRYWCPKSLPPCSRFVRRDNDETKIRTYNNERSLLDSLLRLDTDIFQWQLLFSRKSNLGSNLLTLVSLLRHIIPEQISSNRTYLRHQFIIITG